METNIIDRCSIFIMASAIQSVNRGMLIFNKSQPGNGSVHPAFL